MKNCVFKLGDALVKQRTFYEHVGISVSLSNDDEQILKGRRTLNPSNAEATFIQSTRRKDF